MELKTYFGLFFVLGHVVVTNAVSDVLSDESINWLVKRLEEEVAEEEDTSQPDLSCKQPEGQTPYSVSVTSVRMSSQRVNRTGPPPYGYTEREWSLWDYQYSVTAEVTYITTPPSHCTPDAPFDQYDCVWPNTVPNVVWHLASVDDSNFTTTSVSTRQPNGQYSTTLVAKNPEVIPHVVAKLSLQTVDLAFRFDKHFTQYSFQDNSYERSYPALSFHCYPPKTVRAVVGQDLVFNWSFTIKPTPDQTKADLLNHTIRLNGNMLDRESRNRPPKRYFNKLSWSGELHQLKIDGTPIHSSGWDQRIPRQPGKIFGELEELDDGYTVNLQLRFEGNVVGAWMKGMLRLDLGSIVSVTHLGVDDAETNNETLNYFLQYQCPFDMDMLNVAIYKGSDDVTYERYVEVKMGHELPNGAPYIACRAYGCHIDKLELRRHGQPIHTYYRPDDSDNILRQGYGAYKEIRWYLIHVNEDTLGTYECFTSDKSGNSTSRKIDVIAKRLVSLSLREWTENYAIVACRGNGIPMPTLSFGEKTSQWQFRVNEVPPIDYSQVRQETRWVGDTWFTNEPEGLVVEAVVNITMPASSLKGKVIVCKSHNVYGDKMEEITLNKWNYPKKPEIWD